MTFCNAATRSSKNSETKMDNLATIESADSELIRARILTIRGVQVILDRDLAELYGVATKRLNEQVKRNAERFPSTFMFQLTKDELEDWRSQIATSNSENVARTVRVSMNRKEWRSQTATSNFEQYLKMGVRNRPYAFTEHGVIMLASVLKSNTSCFMLLTWLPSTHSTATRSQSESPTSFMTAS